MRRKGVSVRQARQLDKLAIEHIGIPSCILMERAGQAVAWETRRYLKTKKKARVAVVCGPGNNAGDGFVAARHLLEAGVAVSVFLVGDPGCLKADAAVNYRILKKLHYPVVPLRRPTPLFIRQLERCTLILDALFGVGLNRDIREPYRSIIEAMNAAKAKIFAVDVPSGLDADTGRVYGVCVRAFKTLTFSLPKQGFFCGEGPKYTGKIISIDIGIPAQLYPRVR